MDISRGGLFFLRGLSGRGVKVNTRLHVIPTLKWVELYLHCTLRLDDVDENNFTFLHSTFFFFFCISNDSTKSRPFTVFRSEPCNYQVLGLTKGTCNVSINGTTQNVLRRSTAHTVLLVIAQRNNRWPLWSDSVNGLVNVGVIFYVVVSVTVNTEQRAFRYKGTESRICYTAWRKELNSFGVL